VAAAAQHRCATARGTQSALLGERRADEHFFLLVGLEIRREIHDGTLSDPRIATLPIIAAAGGVVVPALLYMLVARGPQVGRGWAIPTATDIAFAVGVLALIGRVPAALRMLLLTLAIADDIAAILIIAFFYSGGLVIAQFLLVAAGVALVLLLQAIGVRAALAYVFPGAVLWLGMLRAGVHPALAGVVLGLVLGKPLGIVLAALAAVRLRIAGLPGSVRWSHLLLLGVLGGIGFTMSVFIADLAFDDPALLSAAKLAVLVGSAIAATLGFLLGPIARRSHSSSHLS